MTLVEVDKFQTYEKTPLQAAKQAETGIVAEMQSYIDGHAAHGREGTSLGGLVLIGHLGDEKFRQRLEAQVPGLQPVDERRYAVVVPEARRAEQMDALAEVLEEACNTLGAETFAVSASYMQDGDTAREVYAAAELRLGGRLIDAYQQRAERQRRMTRPVEAELTQGELDSLLGYRAA